MPKNTTQQNKKGGKNQKKLPKVDDFFTNYIAKQQFKLNKKLERVADLKKKPESELTGPQKVKMSKASEFKEQKEFYKQVLEVYLTAHKTSEQAPAQTGKPAETQATTVNTQEVKAEVVRESAEEIANLAVVGGFSACPERRAAFASLHKQGENFLEDVNGLWQAVTGKNTESNSEALSNSSALIHSYLTNSAVISGKSTFCQIHEGVNKIASSDAFTQFTTAPVKSEPVVEAEPVTEEPVKEAPVEEVAEPVQEVPVQVEVKLVKTSRKPSQRNRKVSEAVDEFNAEDDDSEEEEAPKVVEKAADSNEEVDRPKKKIVWHTAKGKKENPNAQKRGFRGRGRKDGRPYRKRNDREGGNHRGDRRGGYKGGRRHNKGDRRREEENGEKEVVQEVVQEAAE